MLIYDISSLTAVARISNTMLNNSGESGHTCLVTDLRGNAFSFSLLRIKFAVGLSYMGFITLRYVPSEEHSSEGVRRWNGWMASRCNGPELGQVLGDGEGQGGPACYRPSGQKSWTQLGNWTAAMFLPCLLSGEFLL